MFAVTKAKVFTFEQQQQQETSRNIFFPNDIINRSLLNDTYVSEIYLGEARVRGNGKSNKSRFFSLQSNLFRIPPGYLQNISRNPGVSGSHGTHDCSE